MNASKDWTPTIGELIQAKPYKDRRLKYDIFICCEDMNEFVDLKIIEGGLDNNGNPIAKCNFPGIHYGYQIKYCPHCGKFIKIITRKVDTRF